MPLTQLTCNVNIQWTLSKANAAAFGNTTEGPDSSFFNLLGLSTSTFNQVATLYFTSIAASASETIDLTSLTNLVGESFSFAHVLGIMVLPVGTGSQLTFGPGASNGLEWIWGGTTQTLVANPGSCTFYSDPATATGTVVDSTHKTLTFTNSGGSTMTSLEVIIIGSTT